MFFVLPIKTNKNRLDNDEPTYDGVSQRAQDLISAGLGSDPLMVKQMTETTKDWNDVNDAVANQIKELEAVEAQLENFKEALDDADKAITAAEEKVATLPPVGTDVNTINQQMEDLKVCACNQFFQYNLFRN